MCNSFLKKDKIQLKRQGSLTAFDLPNFLSLPEITHSSSNLVLINVIIYHTQSYWALKPGVTVNWYRTDIEKPQLFPEGLSTCSSDPTNALYHNLFGINNLLHLMRLLTCRKLDKSLCLQRIISCQAKVRKQQTQGRGMISLAYINSSLILFLRV